MGDFKRFQKNKFSNRDFERPRNRSRGRDSERFEESPGGRGFGRSPDREMFDVTCDKCGRACQVPFKPSNSKPVYCSDCFRNEGGESRGPRGRSDTSPSSSSRELEKINQKLDKIMKALDLD